MRSGFARNATRGALSLTLLASGPVSYGQEAQGEDATARRTRVALGAQLVPSFPGADTVQVRPLIDIDRARGSEPFGFEAPDESAGPVVLRGEGWQLGPALGFEGSRSRSDTDGVLPRVGFTVELGGFAQYWIAPPLRIRAELRHGLGGHKGMIGAVSADYVLRDGDRWLFSAGPRVTLADGRYHRAYFGVDERVAETGGLAAYRPDGGVQAVGAAAGLVAQLTPRWGVYSYARYDRLVADPARSPVVRAFGSRDQLSGGVALSFTFH